MEPLAHRATGVTGSAPRPPIFLRLRYSYGVDSFETVLVNILEAQGYWVRPSFKVELTKEDKKKMLLPSCPRWELDTLAYKANTNTLLILECKSYLDSPGVKYASFGPGAEVAKSRYKLFLNPLIREVVFARLVDQLATGGMCAPSPTVTLALAAGHFASDADRNWTRDLFVKNNWLLWDEEWIYQRLIELAASDYQNQVSSVVSKLILRHLTRKKPAPKSAPTS